MSGSGSAPSMALDWINGAPEDLRAGYAAARAEFNAEKPDDVEVEEISVLGVSGLLFTPEGGGEGAPILYFHGGGWVVGAPETHLTLCACLARLSGRRVLSARYRLAPEHPFPAQKVDAVAALNAVLAGNVSQLGNPGRVILAGDSAGAAVALWAEAGTTPKNQTLIERVLCFYGAFGLRDSDTLRNRGPISDGLGQADVAAMYDRLGPDLPNNMFDTFSARGAPLTILIAALDPLADDSAALVERARTYSRPFSLRLAKGMDHGFLHMAGRTDEVSEILEKCVTW